MTNTGAKQGAMKKEANKGKPDNRTASNTTSHSQVRQLLQKNDALVQKALLLQDLIEDEKKKLPENSLSELVDADQKIEVANSTRELDVELSLVPMQAHRLVQRSVKYRR
jgi:hypothetical protein